MALRAHPIGVCGLQSCHACTPTYTPEKNWSVLDEDQNVANIAICRISRASSHKSILKCMYGPTPCTKGHPPSIINLRRLLYKMPPSGLPLATLDCVLGFVRFNSFVYQILTSKFGYGFSNKNTNFVKITNLNMIFSCPTLLMKNARPPAPRFWWRSSRWGPRETFACWTDEMLEVGWICLLRVRIRIQKHHFQLRSTGEIQIWRTTNTELFHTRLMYAVLWDSTLGYTYYNPHGSRYQSVSYLRSFHCEKVGSRIWSQTYLSWNLKFLFCILLSYKTYKSSGYLSLK